MRENFGFNSAENQFIPPPAEAKSETELESGAERRLRAMAIEEINKGFPEAGRDLNLISNEDGGDGSGITMLFSKPGSTFKEEILYIVTVSPDGEMLASKLKSEPVTATSFEDAWRGKRYGKKGR